MREGLGRAGEHQGGPGAEFPVRGSTDEPAYRGFLFADLRGFTAFVEANGERSATDLLDAYRSLVRERVARHAGAEIRTEGDSFYVVFPSARAAVACGLEITAAAARFSEQHPDGPIRVGIGINAGETTLHDDGFVGTAVNLAARVCSQARVGEVLVTATVRDAVRGVRDLRFVPRGSRRLKGIAESVPLVAVEAASAPGRRSVAGWLTDRRTGRSLAIAGVVMAAVVAVAAGLALRNAWLDGPRDDSSAAASATPSAASGQASGDTASEAPASPADSVEPGADLFPNQDEAALLASVGADVEHCERADLDDRPRLSLNAAEASFYWGVTTTRPPLSVRAGVSCTIPSMAAPTSIHYWTASQMRDYGPVDIPSAHVLNVAGTFDVPRGDCAVDIPAFGRWNFGETEGWLLCREVYGDAVFEWTYDGHPIVAVASRRDGDNTALYAWWRDNARFLND